MSCIQQSRTPTAACTTPLIFFTVLVGVLVASFVALFHAQSLSSGSPGALTSAVLLPFVAMDLAELCGVSGELETFLQPCPNLCFSVSCLELCWISSVILKGVNIYTNTFQAISFHTFICKNWKSVFFLLLFCSSKNPSYSQVSCIKATKGENILYGAFNSCCSCFQLSISKGEPGVVHLSALKHKQIRVFFLFFSLYLFLSKCLGFTLQNQSTATHSWNGVLELIKHKQASGTFLKAPVNFSSKNKMDVSPWTSRELDHSIPSSTTQAAGPTQGNRENKHGNIGPRLNYC